MALGLPAANPHVRVGGPALGAVEGRRRWQERKGMAAVRYAHMRALRAP